MDESILTISLVHSGEDNETNWSTSRMHGSRRRRDLRIARNKRRSQRLVDNNDNRGNSLEEIEMQATSANETQPQTSREQQNVSQSSDEQTVAQTYAQHNTLQTVEEQHNDGVNGDNNDSLRISSNNVSTDVITINDTCIDLTSEHDEYELNNIDDNEIECVAINIRNCADLNNIQRNLLERSRPRLSDVARDRSRSPLRRHEDIIDITNSPPPAPSLMNSTSDSPAQSIRTRISQRIIRCPVCLDDEDNIVISGRLLVSTVCGHLFCDRCIKESIKTGKSCPTCRKKLVSNKQFHPIYI